MLVFVFVILPLFIILSLAGLIYDRLDTHDLQAMGIHARQ